MTQNGTVTLAGCTDDELIAEFHRRQAEAQRRIDKLSVALGGPVKMPAKSEAKRAYWAAWREFKASHPTATLEQWQRARKRSK